MADPIAYPASLPCPQTATLLRPERRAIAPAGLFSSRPLSRDAAGSKQRLTFVLTSPAMLQAWLDWGETDLHSWGAWFSADWSQPEGGIGVRRFIGAPSYPEFFPSIGGWRIQADVQLRGQTELPNQPAPIFLGPLILLRFVGANGSQVFNDEGYGHAVWTPSAGVVISSNRLRLPLDTSHLSAEYNENIALLGEDFEIQFDVTPDAGALDGRDWFGIVGVDGFTAAWAFYTGLVGGSSGNRMNFFWHDQDNVEHFIISSVTLPASTTTRILAKRVGSTITLWQAGVLVATSAPFTGSIRNVEGLQLNIGKVPVTGQGDAKAGYFDNVVVVRGPGIADDFL